MQTVIVNIGVDGNVKVEAQGVQGTGCHALTRAIEDAIGPVTADQKKPEYYQQQANHATAGHSHQR